MQTSQKLKLQEMAKRVPAKDEQSEDQEEKQNMNQSTGE
jgi:hypothetical protein